MVDIEIELESIFIVVILTQKWQFLYKKLTLCKLIWSPLSFSCLDNTYSKLLKISRTQLKPQTFLNNIFSNSQSTLTSVVIQNFSSLILIKFCICTPVLNYLIKVSKNSYVFFFNHLKEFYYVDFSLNFVQKNFTTSIYFRFKDIWPFNVGVKILVQFH